MASFRILDRPGRMMALLMKRYLELCFSGKMSSVTNSKCHCCSLICAFQLHHFHQSELWWWVCFVLDLVALEPVSSSLRPCTVMTHGGLCSFHAHMGLFLYVPRKWKNMLIWNFQWKRHTLYRPYFWQLWNSTYLIKILKYQFFACKSLKWCLYMSLKDHVTPISLWLPRWSLLFLFVV